MKTLSYFFLRRARCLSFGRAAFASFVRCRRFPPPPPLLSIEGGGARGEREGERPKKRGERGLQPPPRLGGGWKGLEPHLCSLLLARRPPFPTGTEGGEPPPPPPLSSPTHTFPSLRSVHSLLLARHKGQGGRPQKKTGQNRENKPHSIPSSSPPTSSKSWQ